ncbi:hypothetical protein [Flavobacterium hungaricum]|uniref:Uncharacterized protein n=1 Tax=Flavobacterium hungaricum TaxID=2082725 RepID=A0ABR9TE96_9FLAO|nr:hypothetical protein [Flavobacterium hungaricum]MBE8723379.1 hypothetical protein [Flavobacterium hungaricum]
MSEERELITVQGLKNLNFVQKKFGDHTYFEKGTFFLTYGLNDWSYGWKFDGLAIRELSQIKYIDEIDKVINFKN